MKKYLLGTVSFLFFIAVVGDAFIYLVRYLEGESSSNLITFIIVTGIAIMLGRVAFKCLKKENNDISKDDLPLLSVGVIEIVKTFLVIACMTPIPEGWRINLPGALLSYAAALTMQIGIFSKKDYIISFLLKK